MQYDLLVLVLNLSPDLRVNDLVCVEVGQELSTTRAGFPAETDLSLNLNCAAE